MPGPFDLTPDQMRDFGYRVIDTLVEHCRSLPDLPAQRMESREELERRLREPLPLHPSDFHAVLSSVVRDVFSSIGYMNHPRFYGFIPTPSNFVSVLAEAIAAGYTPFCGTWLEGSGPAEVELVTLDWLRSAIGLPPGAGGLFTSGGSIANLTALAAIRDSRPGSNRGAHVIYASDQTHASVDRAIQIVGYEAAQFRRLESDASWRLQPDALREAVMADRAAGLLPVAVIANAGTTNTGVVDPLCELAEFCRTEGLWLHVDGAYGAAAVFCARGRELLRGLELADSVTLDPHKWLFQPYVMGCLLLRDPRRLSDVFHFLPEYMRDVATSRGEVNFCDYGPELTRPFRALKLWMSLKVFGADAFGRAIEASMSAAEEAAQLISQEDCWELVSPPSLAILCFRFRAPELDQPDEDRLQDAIARASAEHGCCFLSTTALSGRPVLRMCTIQPTTTSDDLRKTLECLRKHGERLRLTC